MRCGHRSAGSPRLPCRSRTARRWRISSCPARARSSRPPARASATDSDRLGEPEMADVADQPAADDAQTYHLTAHHIGITVSDLGRSIPFYRDLLGFKVAYERGEVTAEYMP